MKKLYITILLVIGLLSQSNAQSTYWSVNWDLTSGLGDTNDFIGNISLRGLSVEGRYFINEKLTVGGFLAWKTMYEETDKDNEIDIEIDGNTGTISGTQRRYLNIYPILVNSHYYFKSGGVTPYAGIGIGGAYIEQQIDIGLRSIYSDSFGFSAQPEVGVFIPVGISSTGINLALRYLYTSQAGELNSLSTVTLAVGFGFLN